MGKDVEEWAGNYGTRFKNENLILVYNTVNSPERKIAAETS